MDDQRVEARPPLRRENPRDRGLITCVAAEPVHRLGRERDELARAYQTRGAGDIGVARGNEICRHGTELKRISTGLMRQCRPLTPTLSPGPRGEGGTRPMEFTGRGRVRGGHGASRPDRNLLWTTARAPAA